jgi:lipopolysaccharide/colanic/teichoic acid biosynthesis glycosyltransferase
MTLPADIPPAIDVDPIKAVFDRGLAALGLVLLSPLLAVGSLAILLSGLIRPSDRGPVFYRELRISKGEVFPLFKFRTMQVSAIEEVLAKGLTVKSLERQDRGHMPVGNFLRRFYLDELPQLINILRGEMSFVGPRPSAPREYERELTKGIVRKGLARAGLVGLQQAHKGHTKSFDEEIGLDYEYVRRAGSMNPLRRLAYDVSIIGRSIRILLEGKGLSY